MRARSAVPSARFTTLSCAATRFSSSFQLPVTVDARVASADPQHQNLVFTSFQALVQQIRDDLHAEPAARGAAAPHSPEFVEHISARLRRATLNPREFSRYTRFEPGRYTRTIVAKDREFVLLLLSWAAGQRSAVHDHAGSSCWVKMLSGTLVEQRYALPLVDVDGAPLVPLSAPTVMAAAGGDPRLAVTYMSDARGDWSQCNQSMAGSLRAVTREACTRS